MLKEKIMWTQEIPRSFGGIFWPIIIRYWWDCPHELWHTLHIYVQNKNDIRGNDKYKEVLRTNTFWTSFWANKHGYCTAAWATHTLAYYLLEIFVCGKLILYKHGKWNWELYKPFTFKLTAACLRVHKCC